MLQWMDLQWVELSNFLEVQDVCILNTCYTQKQIKH